MFTQIIPFANKIDISVEDIIDSFDESNPVKNFTYYMIALGAKFKWKEKRTTDIPQLLKDDLKKYEKYVLNKQILEDEDYALTILEEMINKFPSIPVEIDKEYQGYVDSYRLAGNIDTSRSNIAFIKGDNNTEINPIKDFPEFMKNRYGDKIFTYRHQSNDWNWVDSDAYKIQFKIFKKYFKNKKIVVNEEYNREHDLNGHKWHSLVIQYLTNNSTCLGSLSLFKFLIKGYVYYFRNKTDRDNAYNYLTNKKM